MLLLVLLLSVAPHTPSPLPHCASTLMTPSFGRSLGRAVIVRAAVRAYGRACVRAAEWACVRILLIIHYTCSFAKMAWQRYKPIVSGSP